MKELIQSWKDLGKKILVVYVPVALSSVSKRFFESWVALTWPDIVEEMDRQYNVKMISMTHDMFPVDRNRHSAVERAKREFKADFLQMIDADMVFPSDTIPRLMAHISDEFPIATGLYWRKNNGGRCVQGKYSPWSESLENKRGSIIEQGFLAPDGTQTLYYKPLTSFDVVEPVDVTGCGCLLVRMDVFDRLKLPYFKYYDGFSTGGDFTFSGISEDMEFNSQCRKLGIKTLCDPSIRCGHLKEVVFSVGQQ